MSAIPSDWTPHRRDDGELVGWIRPSDDLWVPVGLFGHDIGEPQEWLDAEAALENVGIAWLDETWILETDDGPARVRMVEVTPARILVKLDDFGAIGGSLPTIFDLAWPAPPELRPWREGDPDGRTF